jgi:hypothetical protein
VDRQHSHGRLSAAVLSRGDRISPKAEQISLRAVRAPDNGEAARVLREGVISPVRRAAALFRVWIRAALQHVI